MVSSAHIQTPQEFFLDLLARIKTAKHRIWAQAMILETDMPSGEQDPYEIFFNKLIAANQRGVSDIKVVVDHFSLVSTYCEPDWWPALTKEKRYIKKTLHQKKLDLIQKLRDSAIDITI